MDTNEILRQARRIADTIDFLTKNNTSADLTAAWIGVMSEALQFLNDYAGKESSIVQAANAAITLKGGIIIRSKALIQVLESYSRYLENGLQKSISPKREAQIEVVSDFLDQAQKLLRKKGLHPAAAAVIIGAALEEFLRNWVEAEDLLVDILKPSLDGYAKALKEKELITTQDMKDITSWGGIRNDAAHGKWEEVSNKQRIQLMLEGVNLFMNRYSRED